MKINGFYGILTIMKVLTIKNLQREEGYIYYIRKYAGIAELESNGGTFEADIAFSIETTPFGTKNIDIDINNSINYPVLSVKKSLSEYIVSEDNEGHLPL